MSEKTCGTCEWIEDGVCVDGNGQLSPRYAQPVSDDTPACERWKRNWHGEAPPKSEECKRMAAAFQRWRDMGQPSLKVTTWRPERP